MHTADDEESYLEVKLLSEKEEYVFDLIKNGAQLRNLAFIFRS